MPRRTLLELRKIWRLPVLLLVVGVALSSGFAFLKAQNEAAAPPTRYRTETMPTECERVIARTGLSDCDAARAELERERQRQEEQLAQAHEGARLARLEQRRVALAMRTPGGWLRATLGFAASLPGLAAIAIVGGLLVGAEWTVGAVRDVFSRDPNVRRFVTAKIVALGMFALAVTAAIGVAVAVASAGSRVALPLDGVDSTGLDVSWVRPGRFLWGSVVVVACYVVASVGVGLITRSQFGAVIFWAVLGIVAVVVNSATRGRRSLFRAVWTLLPFRGDTGDSVWPYLGPRPFATSTAMLLLLAFAAACIAAGAARFARADRAPD